MIKNVISPAPHMYIRFQSHPPAPRGSNQVLNNARRLTHARVFSDPPTSQALSYCMRVRVLEDFFRVIRISNGMCMHPTMTEATCEECMILKRIDVLGELYLAMGTRDRLIRFDSKRQNNCYGYPKCDNG